MRGPVVVPWVGLQERVNSLNTEVLQSREHDWTPLSLPEYIDAAALARDGHKRPSTQRLELVADPIAAGALAGDQPAAAAGELAGSVSLSCRARTSNTLDASPEISSSSRAPSSG